MLLVDQRSVKASCCSKTGYEIRDGKTFNSSRSFGFTRPNHFGQTIIRCNPGASVYKYMRMSPCATNRSIKASARHDLLKHEGQLINLISRTKADDPSHSAGHLNPDQRRAHRIILSCTDVRDAASGLLFSHLFHSRSG